MTYYFAKGLELPFAAALEWTQKRPQRRRLWHHHRDRRNRDLEQKLGAEFRNYRILGACNPALAFEALKTEDKVGTMLPCNVIVQETKGGGTKWQRLIRSRRCGQSTTPNSPA